MSGSEPVTKVVCQYALTSANDFPERDPQDWRLLGSNDGGQHWVVLDDRKGEVFTKRHQRRVFNLRTSGAFNVYRLEIERVRDPREAEAVHVAEIEPMGRTEDDLDAVPSPEDLITVQGENAPMESRFQAFDGQVETKWLDFASQHPSDRSSWIQWQYVHRSSLVITNVKQLRGLRARASEGYAVRLDGVLVSLLSGTSRVCFLDASGFLDIACDKDRPFWPGQRVRLEGMSQWVDRHVEIADLRCIAQDQAVNLQPRRIHLGQPLDRTEEFQWVEAEGRVGFCSQRGDRLCFELEANGRRVLVQVLHPKEGTQPKLPGAQVRVRGICGGVLDDSGRRVAGMLWASSLDSVSLIVTNGPADAATATNPIESMGEAMPVLTNILQIRQLSPEALAHRPRVKVRGVTIELFGLYIQDETAGIELMVNPEQPPEPMPHVVGSCVEIIGQGGWDESRGPIIRVEQVRILGKGQLPVPERPSLGQLARGLFVDQWVEIEGVVHSTDGSHLLLICEGGQMTATIRSAPAPAVKALVDAGVRLRGVSVRATDERGQIQGIQLLVPSLDYVEVDREPPDPFSLPCVPISSLLKPSGPKELTHRVKIEGVVTFRQGRECFLQDASGGALALGREEVMLSLTPGPYRWVFYQKKENQENSEEEPDLKPGDLVQAVGYPESQGYSPVLTEVVLRRVAHASPAEPVKASFSDIALGKLDSSLVSMDVVFLGQERADSHVVLELQSGQNVFQALMPTPHDALPRIESGSRVRVRGVCQIEAARFPELGRVAGTFKLLLRTPADLEVLERPPWWTLKRVVGLAGVLVVVLAIAACWIGILHREVERRTHQLKKEVQEHERTEAKLADKTGLLEKEIEERKQIEASVEREHEQLLKTSRLAGMAEVATSVLHNVGNVLNSANMLTSLIAEHLRRSKIPTLGKAVEVMNQHRQDLGRYLTEDEKGKHWPDWIEHLSAHLAEEQGRLRGKVDALVGSMEHIKEVVTMQQRYARLSDMTETASLAQVMEDALRLSGGEMARCDIAVAREYEELPPVRIDRHKVLQILFNLLENAKHACVQDGRVGKQIRLQIRNGGSGRAQLRIIDNGIGIVAENLPRIFTQGFSTRKDGHGFGLHSSILAAQDMGGTLSVQSDGPGEGATFVLEIPLQVAQAKPSSLEDAGATRQGEPSRNASPS